MVDFAAVDRIALRTLQMPDDASIYYIPDGGNKRKLDDAIFRSPDNPVESADLIFEGTGPQFSVHREDAPNLASGDVFIRAGTEYVVKSIGRDEGFMFVAFCRLA